MHSSRSALAVLTTTLIALAANPLAAQGCVAYPDGDPTSGTASTNPFGTNDPNDPALANQALVWRIPTSSLPAQPVIIRSLSFASAGDRTRQFSELEIRLGQTTQTSLNPIITLNMQGFTSRVIANANWQWTTPRDRFTPIGLTDGYPYDPQFGDLVIELVVAGATSSGSGSFGFRSDPTIPSVLQTAWRFAPGRGVVGTGAPKTRICWDLPDLQTFGGGCPGSDGRVPSLRLAGSARIGNSFTVSLRDVPGTVPGTILLFDPRLRATPLDLTGFGAPGCAIQTFFGFNQLLPIQGGAFDLTIPIPNDQRVVGFQLWTQFVPVDLSANTLGLTTSNVGRILVGS